MKKKTELITRQFTESELMWFNRIVKYWIKRARKSRKLSEEEAAEYISYALPLLYKSQEDLPWEKEQY